MVMVRARPMLQALTWRLAPAAPPGSYPPTLDDAARYRMWSNRPLPQAGDRGAEDPAGQGGPRMGRVQQPSPVEGGTSSPAEVIRRVRLHPAGAVCKSFLWL